MVMSLIYFYVTLHFFVTSRVFHFKSVVIILLEEGKLLWRVVRDVMRTQGQVSKG